MSDRAGAGRSRRGLLIVVAVTVLVAVGVAVALSGGGADPDGDGGSGSTDIEAADDDVAAGPDGSQDSDSTSAAEGPEGTREFSGVPDEFPAGLVPDTALDVEGTVARGGDDWSAVVVFRSADERFALEQRFDEASEAAAFTRRNAVEDAERRVIRYDGADGSVLTITLRADGGEQVVGAALVSG